MKHPGDDQSFEDTFDQTVHDMHRSTPRGERPSQLVWDQIASQAGIPETSPIDTPISAMDPKPAGRLVANRANSLLSARPTTHPGWTSWLALALVLLVVGASISFLMQDNSGSNNTSESSIALAPQTPEGFNSSGSSIPVATPFAMLSTDISAFGPEYACDAEPLTEQQVFDIVMNPYRERVRRGSTNAPPLEKPFESETWYRVTYADYSGFVPVNDPELAQSLIETSNEFWNCLMTGTSYQVWGMMDPELVQEEILKVYPVVRDEAVLRQHIKEWGPRLHKESLYKVFPTANDTDPIEVAMTADESYGAIIVQYAGPDFDGSESTMAQVTMVPHPESINSDNILVLLDFVRAADGTWWATKHSWDFP